MPLSVPTVLRVLLLWVAGLGAAAQFAKIAVPFSAFGEIYADAGPDVGWLLSLVSLVGAVFGIVGGDVVARFGPKRVLISGLVLGGALSLWQATGLPFGVMVISRVIEGLSHLAIVVAAPTLIARLSQGPFAGAAMTLWSTFFGVAFALVAWVILPVLGPDPVAPLFAGHGALMLALAALVLLFVPREVPADAARRAQAPGIIAAHIKVYSRPRLFGPGAGWVLYTLTFVSLIAVLPARFPPASATLAAGLMPLVSIAVSLVLVPLMLRRMPSLHVVIIGFVLAALLATMDTLAGLGLAYAVGLFAILGLVQGASFAAVPELNATTEDRALAYGCMAQAGNIGNLLGTPLLLAVGEGFGDSAISLAVAALYCLGALVQWTVSRATRGAP
ncbi:MAG: MFS transporter [Devosiaceae bacterium]|nr:MFS transporter [Devosiaceae bacterium MH13]